MREYGIMNFPDLPSVLVEIVAHYPKGIIEGDSPRYGVFLMGYDAVHDKQAMIDVLGWAGMPLDGTQGWPWQSSVQKVVFDDHSEAVTQSGIMAKRFYKSLNLANNPHAATN